MFSNPAQISLSFTTVPSPTYELTSNRHARGYETPFFESHLHNIIGQQTTGLQRHFVLISIFNLILESNLLKDQN
ncbi:hypothetical protein AQUCO_03100030v1 [Aquilegia coerulea]|uniref:Uncharacterized protein n=1 Tax=Aquilegia coerulea TaxID=218851 RepID=A0A2G5D0G4_AQUCA|nr:hypothetical protein AQUCO_03100030v1 [Aquilegia coerulea]